ncbi:hypothetical protein Ndes2526B_g01116 [Nannochloris sp. 'desiccata']
MPLPAVASSSLLATIQRSNGELEHLHAALARIEDILADERSRAATLREKAHREAQQSATHVQTLSQKINEERCKRRMLRGELSTASTHLKSSVEKNSALLSALASSQEENEVAATLRIKLERELRKSRYNALQLKEQLLELRGELESATISCASKTSIIEKLQTQVAQARVHVSVQTAALASSAANQGRLQTKLSEIEANKSKTVAAMQSENELLRLRLKEARAELAFARNDTAERKAQAGIILLASQRQALCERLQQAQNTIAANSAGIAELQGQVAALHRECKKAKAETAAALADREESAEAVQKACHVFDILHDRLQAAEGKEAAVSMESGRQRAALAAIGRGFEEIAEQLAEAEERLQYEKRSHRGTKAELNAVRSEVKIARRGKS